MNFCLKVCELLQAKERLIRQEIRSADQPLIEGKLFRFEVGGGQLGNEARRNGIPRLKGNRDCAVNYLIFRTFVKRMEARNLYLLLFSFPVVLYYLPIN